MLDRLLTPFLRNLYPVKIEEVSHSIQKEKRIIQTLEPVLNQHKLIVDSRVVMDDGVVGDGLSEDAKLKYQLFYQLSRITLEKGSLVHDDKLDSLAMAVKYWVDAMSLDADKEIDLRNEAALDEALKKFVDGIKGRRPQPKCFF